ncbi:MAG: PAS domain S-box protein, partial [Deltaproteobacteria bacterium]|nr:PAS domain S-box protein [Deltaproteobacteria bacterium]
MPVKATEEDLLKQIRILKKENLFLIHQQESTRSFLDVLTDTIILIKPEGIIIDSNRASAEQFGVSHEKFIGSCLWDYYPPDVAQFKKARVDRVLQTGEAVRFEDEQDGIWHDTVISPLFEGGQTAAKIAIISHDITEHKQIEDLLRFQRDLGIYLSTSRNLPETLAHVLGSILQIDGIDAAGIYVIDKMSGSMDLAVHKGLPADFVERVSHYDAQTPQVSLVKQGIPQYWDYAGAVSKLRELAGSGNFKAAAIIPIRFEDEAVGSLNLISRSFDDIPINARIALETIASRIGGVINRIKAEDMLRKYELIASTVHNPMSFIDKLYIYQAVNDAYLNAFKKSREEIIGHSVADLFGKDVFDKKIRKHLTRALHGKEAHYEEWFDYPAWGKRYVILSYFPYHEKDGTISGIVSISRDITDRRRGEELLKESETRYRHLFEFANDAILIIKDQVIVNCNQKSIETFGGTKDGLANHQVGEFLPPYQADGERSLDKWPKILQSILYDKPQFFEWRFQRLDGSVFDAEASLNYIELKGQYYIQAIIRDITQRKLREEEQIKVSKLESIGTLAGGIAHDFNNILASILGNIELAKTYVLPEDKIHQRLSKAIEACERAKDLTRQFHTLSKGGAPIKKTGPLLPLIRNSSDLTLSGTNVKCRCTIPDNLWIVEFDEEQIIHAFSNIIINARESMPQGGTIRVSAKNTILDSDSFISGVFVPKGPYVRIAIEDHGTGIPAEIRPRIFDPYFTTKELGKQKGMGLGLTTAYSIVKKHNGYIFMETTKGKGTIFYVMLPAIADEGTAAKDEYTGQISENANILFMDDEEMIRDTVSEMLKSLGYNIELCCSGEEAIEKYLLAKNAGHGFDAVILDLTIRGGMGGMETMRKLKELDPAVKGIVSSGYTEDKVMTN